MHRIKLIVALLLVSAVIVVIFQNRQPVETRILFMSVTMPRAALITITTLIGIAIGILTSLSLLGRRRR